jgi:hypothetical protein
MCEAQCQDLVTDVDVDEAEAILEPYFDAVRERFLEAGLERVGKIRLRVRTWVHDGPRHFGACREDATEIVLAPELVELGQDMVVGIIAHEFGHATDFAYPGEFWLGRDDSVTRRTRDDATSDTEWVRWSKAWGERDEDVVELVADAIASSVMGAPIGYLGPCCLQSFADGGIPRPVGLR